MRKALLQVVVATAMTLAVGLLTGAGWPGYVIGAVLALALWVMLFFGGLAGTAHGVVPTSDYAIAALVGVVLGFMLFHLGGDANAAWWAPGFIVAGVLTPTMRRTAAGDGGDDG